MNYKTISSSFGDYIKVTISGGSHEPSISVEIDGLPAGTPIDTAELHKFTQRRAPGNSPFATPRKEPDTVEFLSGVSEVGTAFAPNPFHSAETVLADDQTEASTALAHDQQTDQTLTTNGATLKAIIRNTNTRSSDYVELRDVPRPGHADFTARLKYRDTVNMSGGGPFSARMTAPLCIAGGIAIQMLKERGVHVGAHIASVGKIQDEGFDSVHVQASELDSLKTKDFPVLSDIQGELMKKEIIAAMEEQDSVGGIIEAAVVGLPKGLGGPMYDGLESKLAPILFGIPAVKGVEFGNGFEAATLRGSQNNDPFVVVSEADNEASATDKSDAVFANDKSDCNTSASPFNSCIQTATNNHGGILGGITSGMPLICRVAFKPTPSIGKAQQSVSISKMTTETLEIQGRHDPCVAVRAVPIVEAALAIGILDQILASEK